MLKHFNPSMTLAHQTLTQATLKSYLGQSTVVALGHIFYLIECLDKIIQHHKSIEATKRRVVVVIHVWVETPLDEMSEEIRNRHTTQTGLLVAVSVCALHE